MRSICRGAEPRRLIRNSAGDMNFSSAKKKRLSSRNRLRCSVAERTRRPASKPTARVSDHFVSNSVRPDDVIVNVTSRLSTVWPRPVRLKISGTLSPVRSRSTIPRRTTVSLRTGVEANLQPYNVRGAVLIRMPGPSLRQGDDPVCEDRNHRTLRARRLSNTHPLPEDKRVAMRIETGGKPAPIGVVGHRVCGVVD